MTETSINPEPYKLTQKEVKRLAKFALKATAVGTGLAASAGVGVNAIKTAVGPEAPKLTEQRNGTEVYTVQPGDSAWSIADARVGDNKDVRPFVDDIQAQANSDGTPGLQVGDQIVVPAEHDK